MQICMLSFHFPLQYGLEIFEKYPNKQRFGALTEVDAVLNSVPFTLILKAQVLGFVSINAAFEFVCQRSMHRPRMQANI